VGEMFWAVRHQDLQLRAYESIIARLWVVHHLCKHTEQEPFVPVAHP
jgi:hypothetical protein